LALGSLLLIADCAGHYNDGIGAQNAAHLPYRPIYDYLLNCKQSSK
jgi:hypothetical protein